MKFKALGLILMLSAIALLTWGNPQGSRHETILVMGVAVILGLAGWVMLQTRKTNVPWIILLVLLASCSDSSKARANLVKLDSRGNFISSPGKYIVEVPPGFMAGDTIFTKSAYHENEDWYVIEAFIK